MGDRIEIVSLNCWGLKFISRSTTERINHVIEQILSTPCDILCLQEIWQDAHWQSVRARLKHDLPYSKYYWSGMMGSGLAILSRFPISETDMRPYTLNGRPQAFFRGDWYVGKGVASAIIDLPDDRQCQVFNTHMHAPYNEKEDSYLCHRTAQGWDFRKMLHASVQAGYITFATGDFNSLPGSLVHRFLTTYLSDSFITLNPTLPLLPPEGHMLSPRELVKQYGVTCDVSPLNTWRQDQAPGMSPKRLDYVFHDSQVQPESVRVDFMEPVQVLGCSASDHFGLRCRYRLLPADEKRLPVLRPLLLADYEEMLSMLRKYVARETRQSSMLISYFWFSIALIFAALGFTPASTTKSVQILSRAFFLFFGISGTLSGLIGAIFGWWELRSLMEFEDEIRRARRSHKNDLETDKRDLSGA